jgi:DNA-binding beta-propeller fold protein YncE
MRRGITFTTLLALILAGTLAGSRESVEGHPVSILSPLGSLDATPPAGPVDFLWQSYGAPDDPIEGPLLMAVAPDGTIWVPDGKSDRIRIFSPDGQQVEVWGSPGTGEGQFDFGPNGFYAYGFGSIAFDAAGNIYVLDTLNHRVQKFGPDRRFLTAWGSEGRGDAQFIYPTDIAVDAQGRVFVVDGSRYDPSEAPDATFVQVFDGDGRLLFDWGTHPTAGEQDKLRNSWGIGIDPDGTILLADGELNIIQRFTPEGMYLETLGEPGSGEARLNHSADVAVDGEGRVYVTEWNGARVTVLDRNGQVLASWGERGEGEGQFVQPYGLVLDGQGNVYVSDYLTRDSGRLQAFRILSLPAPEATPAL